MKKILQMALIVLLFILKGLANLPPFFIAHCRKLPRRTRIVILAMLALLAVSGGTLYWGKLMLLGYGEQALSVTEKREFEVVRGMSLNQLARVLEQEGLLESSWKLKALVKLRPELAKIRSGLYEIVPKESLSEFLQKLTQGKQKIFVVTLIEGKTLLEWQETLSQMPYLQPAEEAFNLVLQAQGDDSNQPEGKFFPDTYQYLAGDKVTDVLQMSYLKMQQELENAWQQRDVTVPLNSAYELLILASIIEKETGKADERPWISAVFANRLKQGMRLQTDPTVIYGMGERFNGNITRKDLREFTPFNTYRIEGLPPTPIAAPGRASLLAAAKPAAVDYVYFVSKNDGSHVFSTTLDEHNRAVDKYQRNQP
jgi:UPF0755 protein